MNNSGPNGSMEALKDLKINKKIYIHINTTNPILLPSSNERKIVEENGWQVSYDGMEINL
jgi:pyrroloquinoline quinone biosynthesis protein B